MTPELSPKSQYLATLYRFLLQTILLVLYMGQGLSAIIEYAGKCMKATFIGAVQAFSKQLAASDPSGTKLKETHDHT